MGSKLPNDVKHPKSKIPQLYVRDDDGGYRTLTQHEFKVWGEKFEQFLVSQGLHDRSAISSLTGCWSKSATRMP